MKNKIIILFGIISFIFTTRLTAQNCEDCQGKCCDGNCDPPPGSDPFPGPEVIRSYDPNDLVPPNFDCKQGWARRGQPLAYTIRFENDPMNATAAAQTVVIYYPIPPKADISKIKMGDFGFGAFYFVPPQNTPPQYSAVLNVRSAVHVDVRVEFGLEQAMNRLFWRFTSLDTLTGQPTLDPIAGFLPVNDTITHQGEGFVTYTIEGNPTSMTYDTLVSIADIYFDNNDSIQTPRSVVTIDADPPVSTVSPVVTAPDAEHLRLEWSGTDIGCGLANYTLFVSVDSSSYAPWLVETDTTVGLLPATLGHTYRILCIARDSVKNVEQKPPFDLEITFTPDLIQGGPKLAAKVLLLGCYDDVSGLMKDDIRQAPGVFPLAQPYTALGYAHTGTESISQSVLAVTGSNAIVDWIQVELRSKTNATQVQYSRSALLQRDGDIVDTDGISPLTFTGAPADDYYVFIRHRNHLSVGTQTAVAVGAVPLALDFTNNTVTTFGTDAQATVGNKLLLWSGDANGDGKVIYAGSGTDVNAVSAKVFTNPLNPTFSATIPFMGYDSADLNLDGRVTYAGAGTDVNFISQPVFTFPLNTGLSPTFVLLGQLP